MSTIYITGHKNPDLDCICSAYGYAKLMNMQDAENTYIPVRCGHMSESVKKILDHLEIDIPKYKRDVFPKVGDVLMNPDHHIDADDELTAVAAIYEKNSPSAIPVYENGSFFGLLSVADITGGSLQKTAR